MASNVVNAASPSGPSMADTAIPDALPTRSGGPHLATFGIGQVWGWFLPTQARRRYHKVPVVRAWGKISRTYITSRYLVTTKPVIRTVPLMALPKIPGPVARRAGPSPIFWESTCLLFFNDDIQTGDCLVTSTQCRRRVRLY